MKVPADVLYVDHHPELERRAGHGLAGPECYLEIGYLVRHPQLCYPSVLSSNAAPVIVSWVTRGEHRHSARSNESGQASLLLLGMLAALLAGTLILFGFGQALGARGKHQRAADLAAVSAAQVMSLHYSRLFEPAVFENGLPNPRHLSNEAYLALARAAALRGARRNGVATSRVEGRLSRGRVRAHPY